MMKGKEEEETNEAEDGGGCGHEEEDKEKEERKNKARRKEKRFETRTHLERNAASRCPACVLVEPGQRSLSTRHQKFIKFQKKSLFLKLSSVGLIILEIELVESVRADRCGSRRCGS